jgi:hypothetical protein
MWLFNHLGTGNEQIPQTIKDDERFQEILDILKKEKLTEDEVSKYEKELGSVARPER